MPEPEPTAGAGEGAEAMTGESLPDVGWGEAFLRRRFAGRRIGKVLLVNPPDADASLFRYDTAKRRRYTNYPPYGPAILAQNLRTIGLDVRIVNLNHEILKRASEATQAQEVDFDTIWQARLEREILAFQPDLIGVTCMFTMTHSSFAQVCKHAARFGIPLAIGGVHVSNDVERVLDDVPCAEFAFLHEADVALRRFVQVVNGEAGVEALGQVILNDGSTRYRFLWECTPSSDDISLIPALDLLEIAEYAEYGTIGAFYCFKPPGVRFATVLSNRGCRARCTFCSVRNFNGPGVRRRTVASVVDELEKLQNDYDVGHVMWLDDDLLSDHQRAIELFNAMVQRRLRMTWDATNGVIAASCTHEVIAAAAESGCIALNIGVESGNPRILREIRKPGTVETFVRAAEVLRRYETIHSSVFLMIGFPAETLSMILDTLNLAREMDLDWYRISVLQPLSNTPIYDSMVAQGLIRDLGSKEVRFMGGAYGKQLEIEQGLRLASLDFEEAFMSIPLGAVPTPEQLTDIWFYMNYHLNFHRLFGEKRTVKIRQQIQHLHALSDVISPEHGFALYFLGYLQHRMTRAVEPGIIERLDRRLATSPYWRDRFRAFRLSPEDLITRDFHTSTSPG